jgi:hypothetical protein
LQYPLLFYYSESQVYISGLFARRYIDYFRRKGSSGETREKRATDSPRREYKPEEGGNAWLPQPSIFLSRLHFHITAILITAEVAGGNASLRGGRLA